MNPIVPVYYQIKQAIKKWIINRELNPGDKIPSEHILAKKFNVSRLTVRQAISQLIQEGLVASEKGKGTFVTNNQHLIDSFSSEFTGIMDDLLHQVTKITAKEVEMSRLEAPEWIKNKLKLDKASKEVVQIRRVRFKGDKTFAYTINYLPVEIGTHITESDLYKKPLLQILEQDLGIQFTEAFETIEASFADQKIAEKLGILTGSPIIFIERIMYTKNQKPVELVQSSIRGDAYKYIVRLRNFKRKRDSIWIQTGL